VKFDVDVFGGKKKNQTLTSLCMEEPLKKKKKKKKKTINKHYFQKIFVTLASITFQKCFFFLR
jgi:hypothetical protein